ncbi:MAG: Rrf2 family transcriptional regulator [Vallitaleaceae bacterium]|jgi:Rrf2 family protein|nr:Rrf2 family transcriptional regulator [Vallitaleaceae bacterium]
MRISAKGRYALASMIDLAVHYNNNENITVLSISERLDISKIYLEQVFALLKRGGLVISIKGSQGGYKLNKNPMDITMFDILESIEVGMFEEIKEVVGEKSHAIDDALQIAVFGPLDSAIKDTLIGITLEALLKEVEKQSGDNQFMFYI